MDLLVATQLLNRITCMGSDIRRRCEPWIRASFRVDQELTSNLTRVINRPPWLGRLRRPDEAGPKVFRGHHVTGRVISDRLWTAEPLGLGPVILEVLHLTQDPVRLSHFYGAFPAADMRPLVSLFKQRRVLFL